MSVENLPDLGVELTPWVVVAALLSGVGVTATDDLEEALVGSPVDWFVWTGRTPGDNAGRYWIPALFPVRGLPDALIRLSERRRDDGLPHDMETCRDAMAAYHSGLGKKVVGGCPWAYAEIDHLPRAEQEARYRALSAATGLAWCLWVFTGGKSVHAYLAFSRLLDPNDPIREEIQRLLVTILEGDTRITDPGRLMRLPNWNGSTRKQPVVHLDLTVRYDPVDVRDRLRAYADALGITDLDVAYRTLQLAERVEVAARKELSTEAAIELREHAAVLRATRATPSHTDLKLAEAMLGAAPAPMMSLNRGAVTGAPPNAVPVTGTSPEWAPIRAAHATGRDRLDNCPWCHAASSRVTSILTLRSGALLAYCFAEGVGRAESYAGVALDPDVEEIIDEVLAVTPSSVAVVDEDPEVSDLTEADERVAELERETWRPHVAALIATEDLFADLIRPEEPSNGSTSTLSELRAPSLFSSPYRLEARSSSDVGVSPSDPDPDLGARVEEALERFLTLGGDRAWCPRGPLLHTSLGVQARETRLPCYSHRCSFCRPRLVSALRAAIRVVVRRIVAEPTGATWRGTKFTLTDVEHPVLDRMAEWAAKAPSKRYHLVIATSPAQLACLLLWSAPDHRPVVVRGGGALRRHIDGNGTDVAHDKLHEVADAVAGDIDMAAWPDADRAVVLRGHEGLTGRVAELRDRVLGRSRALGKAATDRFAVRSYTSGEDVRREASRRVRASVLVEEPDTNRRAGSRTTTWSIASGCDAKPVLEAMAKDGFFLPVRARRTPRKATVTVTEPGVEDAMLFAVGDP